jgi:SHS2 domain-containing protein
MNDETGSFRIVEDISSADYVFDAWGESPEALFSACALACFSAMTDPAIVEQTTIREFEVTADNIDDLLYNFMAELIYIKDADKLFLSRFELNIADNLSSLKAVVGGEPIDYNKHVIKTDVKAVTYHGLHVRNEDGCFVVRMILDL